MDASMKYKKAVLAVILATAFLSSCNRHLPVTKSEYTQYGIDAGTEQDSSAIRFYLPYKQKMEAEMNRVIGQTDQALTKPAEPETLMGNYFADAMLTEGRKKEPTAQFTIATKGGLRTTFPKGNITVSNVFELMPFENEVVILKLSGENVQKLIDFIALKNGQPVSGIRMKIRDNKAYEVTIAGEPFDINKTYNLLTYDYLADGGDELSFLSNPLERRDIGIKVRDAILENINDLTSQGKKITAQLDGRIVIVKD